MNVPEGTFQLYSYITPALKAGDYRFEVQQQLGAVKGTSTLGADDLKVGELDTHVRVTAPRYQLPPDQVLSTYPPAGTEGAYGERLPQIVIKRRTLPWERGLTLPDPAHPGSTIPVGEKVPWLALVLIAEGEAELRMNQDVASCVTAGVHLDGEPDVAKGNCLVVRQSIIDKVFPTRKDIPLLAHARQVDVNDTELMMGDDDGFLAVVISNRLPVAGVDAAGQPVPVKYLACLINLEGQLDALLPEAPPPQLFTLKLQVEVAQVVPPAVFDHVAGGGLPEHWMDPSLGGPSLNAAAIAGPLAESIHGDAPHAGGIGGAQFLAPVTSAGPQMAAYNSQKGFAEHRPTDVYASMAADFAKQHISFLEPEYTFPVLIHWSFVSTGDVTFEYLMTHLGSGLLGTTPDHEEIGDRHDQRVLDETGRERLEVVETGHVGLTHRTRRGDTVRTWYRGPLLPHPASGDRLPIAHSSDQLRAVVPDGREDLSLATAFEVGRLLALNRPSMVAALLRWRQLHFQAARGRSIWDELLVTMPFGGLDAGGDLRRQLDGRMWALVAERPADILGPPRELLTPGDPIDWGAHPLAVLSKGYGLQQANLAKVRTVADLGAVSTTLRDITPAVIGAGALRKSLGATAIADGLAQVLDAHSALLMSNVLATETAHHGDPLDGVLARRPRKERS